MPGTTREAVIDALENGWGSYVGRYRSLSKGAQDEFVRKQGYARLSDLLAHVVAWWEMAIPRIPEILADPDCPEREVDVDRFNAAAVEHFQACDEETMICTFEATRKAMIDLVMSLPENAFQIKRINDRLYIETRGHLSEHAFQ